MRGGDPKGLDLDIDVGMSEDEGPRTTFATPDRAQSESVPLSNLEISKDTLQTAVESGFEHVGRIAAIITGAGRDITRELGEWATDMFEMRDAAARARADRGEGGEHPAAGEDDEL